MFLLKHLLTDETGSQRVTFASQGSFETSWAVQWSKDNVHITANWISVQGMLHPLLNDNNLISLSKAAFLSEWKMLLQNVLSAVKHSLLIIKNHNEVKELQEIVEALPRNGVLYEFSQTFAAESAAPDSLVQYIQNTVPMRWQSSLPVPETQLQETMNEQDESLPQEYQYLLHHLGAGTLVGKNNTVRLKHSNVLRDDAAHEKIRRYVPGAFVFADDGSSDEEAALYFYDTLDWIGYGAFAVLLWPWSDSELNDIIFVGQDLLHVFIQADQAGSFINLPSLDNDL